MTAAPKSLITISISFIALAAVFGILNNLKLKTLQDAVSGATAQQEEAEIRQITREKNLRAREAAAADATRMINEADTRAAKAKADLAQAQKEKADLQAKIDTTEAEIVSLRRNVQELSGKLPLPEIPGVPASTEADAQMDELRQSLDGAEREKIFLADKLRVAQQRTAQLEDERKRRVAAGSRPGVRGTVLVVNRAYNFVVLNLGGRQGVEPNTELLVVRNSTLIGKIRISSVEPATSIGDIVSGSLARGVQVQPGDIVIYAGSSF